MNANGHNAQDLRVRTLAKPNRGRDAIGRYQPRPCAEGGGLYSLTPFALFPIVH